MYVKTDDAGDLIQENYSLKQLREDIYPSTLIADPSDGYLASEFNMHKVVVASKPEYEVGKQRLRAETSPVYVDGQWVINWKIEDLTKEQLERQISKAGKSRMEVLVQGLSKQDKKELLKLLSTKE